MYPHLNHTDLRLVGSTHPTVYPAFSKGTLVPIFYWVERSRNPTYNLKRQEITFQNLKLKNRVIL